MFEYPERHKGFNGRGKTAIDVPVVGAVAIGAAVATGLLVPPSTLLEAVESVAADPLLFGFVVARCYLVRLVLALPTTPLAAVVGYGYGVALGVPLALLGVVTTVIPVFFVARWIAGSAASTSDPGAVPESRSTDGPLGSLLERTGTVVARYYGTAGPLRGVVASRLAPIPSDVATCAAAVSGVELRRLVVGTALGELPWTVAAVVVGASTATTNGLDELGLTLTIICGLAALCLLAGPAYRFVRTRTRARNAGRPTES